MTYVSIIIIILVYKISGDDTVFEVFKLSYILPTRHIETVIFNMVNEYSFKGT